MVRNEFTFPSADGKTSIHAVEWLPEGAPRAVVQLSHGVAEHILRYEPFARFLTAQGFAVAGHDHLGHGASVAPGAPRLYFGPKGSWQWVVDDLYTLRHQLAEQFPHIPCYLLGHSMGSFLARTYLIRFPGTVSGAILMGTGQPPAAVTAAGRLAAAEEVRRLGEERPSPLLEHLIFGSYARLFAPCRTDCDWILPQPGKRGRLHRRPPLRRHAHRRAVPGDAGGPCLHRQREKPPPDGSSTPILFLSGTMDPVGGCGKEVRQVARRFEKAGVREVSLRLYPELRHELLNEDCRESVCHDILHWLEERTK